MGRMSAPSPSDLPSIRSITVGGLDTTRLPSALALESAAPIPLRQHGPNALTASARRITGKKASGPQTQRGGGGDTWKADAWDAYDLVGEQRFLATVLANQGAQARFYVGTTPDDDPLGDPIPTKDEDLTRILDALGGTPKRRAQIVQRALINYFVGGEVYYVGIPSALVPDVTGEADAEAATDAAPVVRLVDRSGPVESAGVSADPATVADLQWYALSPREVAIFNGEMKLKLPELGGSALDVKVDDVWPIHSWRSHPERGWEPDSPTRSSLPVLRELIGLTMTISAQLDSRLAGAGLLLIAQKVTDAAKVAAGIPVDSEEDPFTDALLETMSAPIADRSSAASYVPLVAVVPDGVTPDEAAALIQFASPLDAELRPLREEAIRRLALGEDAPPELLLGVGGMNHWGAWLVREDVVETHITPPLSIIADAWTTQYLHPAMRAAGYSAEDIGNTVVWYSVDHMIARPNRAADAQAVYDKGELSGEALRRENGFDEADAPPVIGVPDPAVDLALQLVAQAPSLAAAPGIPALVEQIRAIQAGREATAAAADEAAATGTPSGAGAAPAGEDSSGGAEGNPPAEIAAPANGAPE